jgi:hypothetical protein
MMPHVAKQKSTSGPEANEKNPVETIGDIITDGIGRVDGAHTSIRCKF